MLPVIFLGHGNPMNAILDNEYTAAWTRLGWRLARPRAILVISAHWYVRSTGVTMAEQPETIYDFGGFPPELYRVTYPAPGEPTLARRVRELLSPIPVDLDPHQGLDHGTWSVLKRVYPAADIPVVQLGIDATKPPAFHYEIGQRLAPLREKGVLIVGSGNLVHNLRAFNWGKADAPPFEWASRFQESAKDLILTRDFGRLVDYPSMGSDALLSVPTPEHYLPLLYVLGASQASDAVKFPVEGVDGGSVSMLAVELG